MSNKLIPRMAFVIVTSLWLVLGWTCGGMMTTVGATVVQPESTTNVIGTFHVQLVDLEAFDVTADLEGVDSEQVYIQFRKYGLGRDDLDQRFEVLEALTPSGKELEIITLGDGRFQIDSQGLAEIQVRYRLAPAEHWWDHHLPVVTDNHLYLPMEYFLFMVYATPDFEDVVYDRVKLELVQLPEGWQLLTTCSTNDDGTLEIESGDSIVYAGRYSTKTLQLDDDRFTIALNQGFGIDETAYFDDFKRVIQYQYQMMGDYPASEALIVINPKPEFRKFFRWGGQGKAKNIIIYYSKLDDSVQSRKELVSLFAHESFHLWVTRSFVMEEDLYWFSEGFNRYQQYYTMWQTGILSQDEFHERLAEAYVKCDQVQKEIQEPLVETGKQAFRGWKYTYINYEKGAMVAHLLNRKLVLQDEKSFSGLMRDIYQQLAVPQIPLNSKQVIRVMDQYLGDHTFTQEWLLNYRYLPVSEVPELKSYIGKKRVIQFLINPPIYVRVIVVVLVLILVIWMVIKSIRRFKKANRQGQQWEKK